MDRPRVFVGSSTEAKAFATAVHSHFCEIAEVTVWPDGAFRQNEGNLEALFRLLDYFDFAVFVLSPDDDLRHRGENRKAPRDNVLFEFGLFLGRLGRERCFAIASNQPDLHLPSDLRGITIARYDSSRSDGNERASTRPACQMILEEITKLGPREEQELPKQQANTSQDSEALSSGQRELENFLSPGEAIAPHFFQDQPAVWFHNERFTKAFPGVRGIHWITDPQEAVSRLQILLGEPLTLVWENDRLGIMKARPIWWWRGHSNLPISEFKIVDDSTVVIENDQLRVSRIAAVNERSYWQSFVYVECIAEPQIGPHKYTDDAIEEMIRQRGFADEEVGLFKEHVISRAEYDDGAAVIDGKVVRTEGAELRGRMLSPYNLLIAPQSSPINDDRFDSVSWSFLNGILRGTASFEALVEQVLSLPNPQFSYRSRLQP